MDKNLFSKRVKAIEIKTPKTISQLLAKWDRQVFRAGN